MPLEASAGVAGDVAVPPAALHPPLAVIEIGGEEGGAEQVRFSPRHYVGDDNGSQEDEEASLLRQQIFDDEGSQARMGLGHCLGDDVGSQEDEEAPLPRQQIFDDGGSQADSSASTEEDFRWPRMVVNHHHMHSWHRALDSPGAGGRHGKASKC